MEPHVRFDPQQCDHDLSQKQESDAKPIEPPRLPELGLFLILLAEIIIFLLHSENLH